MEIFMDQNKMILRYRTPAPHAYEFTRFAQDGNSWERYSLPLGNGYFGANVFGRTDTERIQISEPSMANPYYTPSTVKRKGSSAAGVNSFAEILIDFGHKEYTDYQRTLSLDTACAEVSYTCDGTGYKRRIFTSYPDKVLVASFEADKKASVSFFIKAEAPFLGEYTVEPGDGLSKSGSVCVKDDTLVISGEMGYYGIEYYGELKVVACGGSVIAREDGIKVEKADSATLIFSCDTNYQLEDAVFFEEDHSKKLLGKRVDKDAISRTVRAAADLGSDKLFERHTEDYRALFDRTALYLGEAQNDGYTDELIAEHRNGKRSMYLEALVFQYGRYLLIASSRSRLPANLQGLWNAYCDSPWSSGYWHNINVQMNYWPSGPANLSETFIPYINYAKAYMRSARRNADRFVKANYPENYSQEGENGWIIGTGCSPYRIDGFMKVGHSGPGTGAFTSLLFWDHYDFTHDTEFLKEFAYPALREMSLFFTKILVKTDGKYLIRESASPENVHNGAHYHTVGCAFDQQMVYENFKRTVQAARILGISDEFTAKLEQMLPHLDPVLIGDDGQVKEYREESGYSSIGDPTHRHISHLVGLYPGTIINANTPKWIEGAKVTLTGRGDRSKGWAVAHRLLLWARTKTPQKCRDLIDSFIANNLLDNLLDTHPPFQIDGNFGYTAGVCEMLLQSHSEFTELLPSLPREWENGYFKGLVARGGFVIDCFWEKGRISLVRVRSSIGGELKIKLPAHLLKEKNTDENGIYSVSTVEGQTLEFRDI